VPSTVTRRPLPALVSLVALLLLTGLVWWRVLHRDSGGAASPNPCPSSSTAATVTLPAPADVTVVVLNSTSRAGIAARARTILSQDGFNVPALAKNDSAAKRDKILSTAEIRFGPRGRQAATLLRYYFPGATLVGQPFTSSTVVVSLGAKFTQVALPAAVGRAMAGDHVTVAAPSPSPSDAPASGSASATPSSSPSC
jgi:hypothetical protein